MSLSIDWSEKIIAVPKSYLTLIQASPTEIRELDLNLFHGDLRDIESSENGVPHDMTHNHNTTVDVGGITLARVVELINGYTITFEDGQYAVNITGGNSNVGDNVNVNQVSVRSFNSAGLVTQRDVEYASFNGGVTIDTTSSYVGTTFPVGTPRQPVNNITDALLIAEVRGFDTLYFIGNFTFENTHTISAYSIYGNHIDTVFTLNTPICFDTEFYNCTLQGTLNGGNQKIIGCELNDVTNFSGIIRDSILRGTLILDGSDVVEIINSFSGVAGTGTPIVDMGGSGRELGVRSYTGGIKIKNLTGSENVSVDFVSGQLKLDSTVTAGTFVVRGAGIIAEDLSTGTTINADGLTNPGLIWDVDITQHLTADTTGEALALLFNEVGGKWEMISNQLIIYKADNVTEVARFNLFDSSGTPAMTDVTKRERV